MVTRAPSRGDIDGAGMCAGPVSVFSHEEKIRNLRASLRDVIDLFPDCGEREIARQKASEFVYWLDATKEPLA